MEIKIASEEFLRKILSRVSGIPNQLRTMLLQPEFLPEKTAKVKEDRRSFLCPEAFALCLVSTYLFINN